MAGVGGVEADKSRAGLTKGFIRSGRDTADLLPALKGGASGCKFRESSPPLIPGL